MVELSPEEQERLRKLEEEVDSDREALRKRREELEQKALVPVVETSRERAVPVVSKEPSSSSLPVPAGWRTHLRRNVTIGAAAVVAGFFVVSNLVYIVGGAVIVGGVWYAAGRYFASEESAPPKSSEDGKGV